MYNREFHTSIENTETPQAIRLAEYIRTYIRPSFFIDFGCSTGIYVNEVKKQLPDIKVVGFEFSREAVDHAMCPDVVCFDLTQKLSLDHPENTLGLCLEVLEHIDDSNWKPVLENITNNCNRVIFSAAIPGQGGIGHINCRPKIDWIKRFYELGWVVDLDATKHLLGVISQGYHMGWFTQNAMVLIPYAN